MCKSKWPSSALKSRKRHGEFLRTVAATLLLVITLTVPCYSATEQQPKAKTLQPIRAAFEDGAGIVTLIEGVGTVVETGSLFAVQYNTSGLPSSNLAVIKAQFELALGSTIGTSVTATVKVQVGHVQALLQEGSFDLSSRETAPASGQVASSGEPAAAFNVSCTHAANAALQLPMGLERAEIDVLTVVIAASTSAGTTAVLYLNQSLLHIQYETCAFNYTDALDRTGEFCVSPSTELAIPFNSDTGVSDIGENGMAIVTTGYLSTDETAPSGETAFVALNVLATIEDGTSLQLSSGTFMIWFRVQDTSFNTPILNKQGLLQSERLSISCQSSGVLRVQLYSGTDTSSYSSEAGLLQDGRWTQVILAFGADGLAIYVDGTLVFSDPSHTQGMADVQGSMELGCLLLCSVVHFDDIAMTDSQLSAVDMNHWYYCQVLDPGCGTDELCRGLDSGFECFNPCDQHSCHNGGTCEVNMAVPQLAVCHCPSGYLGPTCATQLPTSATTAVTTTTAAAVTTTTTTVAVSTTTWSECDNNPCQNGATCTVIISLLGIELNVCHCTNGFYGVYCQYNDGNGFSTTVASTSSHTTSTTTTTDSQDSDGSSLLGLLCSTLACLNGGQCEVSSGVAICTCPIGFVGDRCQAQLFCPADLHLSTFWPVVLAGSALSLPCPGQLLGNMTRQCGLFGWADVDVTGCVSQVITDATEHLVKTAADTSGQALNLTALRLSMESVAAAVDETVTIVGAIDSAAAEASADAIEVITTVLTALQNSTLFQVDGDLNATASSLNELRRITASVIRTAGTLIAASSMTEHQAQELVGSVDKVAGILLRYLHTILTADSDGPQPISSEIILHDSISSQITPWLSELLQFETRGSGPRANITVGQAHVDLPQTLFGALSNNDTALGISVSLMPRAHALGLNLTESLAAALSGGHHQLLVGSKLVSASAYFLAQNDPSDVSTEINGSFPVADLVDLRVPVLDALSAAQDMAAMIADDAGSGEQGDMHVDDAQWNLVEHADGSGLVYQLSFTIVRAILSDNDTSLEVTEQTHVVIVRPTCAWLDLSQDAWNNEGCSVADVSKDAVVCRCNHLTNFAVLMNADTAVTQGSHAEVLSTFGLVTMGVSLVFYTLIAASVTLLWMRRHAKLHHKMLLQLAIAGLCLQAVFVAVSFGPYDYDACVAVSSLLHYSFLALSMNMLAQAYLLYKYFVIVMPGGLSDGAVLFRATVATWLVPLVVVVPAVLVDPSGYVTWSNAEDSNPAVEPEPELCWVSPGSNIYLIAIVPLAVVVGICAIVYVRAMTTVTRAKAATRGLKARLRASVAFFFVLGLSWAFGLLVAASDDVGLQYVFAILSLLQGPVLWYFNCWSNKDVRLMYRQLVGLERSTTSKSVFVGRKGTAKTSTRSGGTWLLSPKWSKNSMQNRPPSAQSRRSSTPCSLMSPTESRKTSVEKRLGKATANIATRLQTLHEQQESSVSDEHSTTHAYDSQATVTSADVSVRILSGAAPSTDMSSFIATGSDHARLSTTTAKEGRQSFDSSVVYSSDEDDESDGSENDAALGYVHVDK